MRASTSVLDAIVPGSRLARFIEAADELRKASLHRVPDQVLWSYDDARARLLDADTAETQPAPPLTEEQAQAILAEADGAPPTRPSVAPGDDARAREADARSGEGEP